MKRKRVVSDVYHDDVEEEEPESFMHPTYTSERRRNWHSKVFDSIGTMGFGDRWRILEDAETEHIGGEFNFNARFHAPSTWNWPYNDDDDVAGNDRVLKKTWRTLLGEAIFQNDDNAFDKLLKRGVDPELPCAYEIVRVTSAGPVMQLYRPLTYAVRRGRMDMLRHLLNSGVNLTHAPTDTLHATSLEGRYFSRKCLEELGMYDAWIRCRYTLQWLHKVPLDKTPWRDLIHDHIVPRINEMGYADWADGEYVPVWGE